MSLTTYFQFTQTSLLPLPPTRSVQTPQTISPISTTATTLPPPPTSETADDILSRGLTTALSMLHSPELMIALNPLVQHYTRISPSDPSQSAQLVDLPRLAPEFNVKVAHPSHSCHAFGESQSGEFVHYEIRDKFNMLFGSVSKLLTYKACFRPLYPDGSVETDVDGSAAPSFQAHTQQQQHQQRPQKSIGLETLADPGSGVVLLGKWTLSLSPSHPASIVLTESVKVHCNFLFGWFVRSQLETAHAELHKEFGVRFVRAMIEGDPMRGKDFRGGKSWGEVSRGMSVGSGNVNWNARDQDKEMNSMFAERKWDGDGGREQRRKSSKDTGREDVVSWVGDDVSVSAGGGGRSLQRTRTNESGVSSMR